MSAPPASSTGGCSEGIAWRRLLEPHHVKREQKNSGIQFIAEDVRACFPDGAQAQEPAHPPSIEAFSDARRHRPHPVRKGALSPDGKDGIHQSPTRELTISPEEFLTVPSPRMTLSSMDLFSLRCRYPV